MGRGALLFDLDGTLTEPREGITRCLRFALERAGASPPLEADLSQWIGPPLHESLRVLLGPAREHLVASALSDYRERYASLGIFENAACPGILQALESLKKAGWALFVATSKPTVFARRIVQHFDFLPHFSGVYGSELSGERSDKAELIAYLLREEGIPAESAVMIGDRLHDVAGARSNGVRAIGVSWGYGSREELVSAGATVICDSVAELVALLGNAERASPDAVG